MLKNLKKLNDQIMKGNFKQAGLIATVQLLIDCLTELLQVVIKQLSIEEGREASESQKAFMSGLKGNIQAFLRLKDELRKINESDGFGEWSLQPPGGNPFAETKPKNIEENDFFQQLVKENKQEKDLKKEDGLGL